MSDEKMILTEATTRLEYLAWLRDRPPGKRCFPIEMQLTHMSDQSWLSYRQALFDARDRDIFAKSAKNEPASDVATPTSAQVAQVGSAELTCPLCGESGFDIIGFKGHYRNGWCEVWEATPDEDPRLARQKEKRS